MGEERERGRDRVTKMGEKETMNKIGTYTVTIESHWVGGGA